MLTQLSKHHDSLNEQAKELNSRGAILATECLNLHKKCPKKALGTVHEPDYRKLVGSLLLYKKHVAEYEKRVRVVSNLADKTYETRASLSKLDTIIITKIRDDLLIWHQNVTKLQKNIEDELALAEPKLV